MPHISMGSTIAGYRIESTIGRGGMGMVFLATQLSLGRPVALKVITPHLADDAAFRLRFLAESEVMASIDHPNVIPVYEAAESDGLLFLAMRYVDGPDLGALVRAHGRLPLVRAAHIIRWWPMPAAATTFTSVISG
jgi:serine/threonine protein kinase